MLKKKALCPPLFFWSTSSPSTPTATPELSPASSSSDTDSDGDMDLDSSLSRAPSPAVPSGAFCPMRPTLSDVLANTAPPPYTLSSFMAYLSQNHCLETLEFTLEAKRYGEAYASLSTRLHEVPVTSDCDESRHLRMLWHRLMSAYIHPGSPREINLPSEVRDGLLALANEASPPSPQNLDHAVRLIHELMDESIFLPFLNSHSSPTKTSPDAPFGGGGDEDVRVVSSTGLDDHATRPTGTGATRSKSGWKRISPQTSTGDLISPHFSASASSHAHSHHQTQSSTRSNFPLPLSAITTRGKSRSSGPSSASGSGDTPSGSVSGTLTDDSGSLHSSPSEPMTPPKTPPGGDLASSPKGKSENPWKKMGLKLGFKKRGVREE